LHTYSIDEKWGGILIHLFFDEDARCALMI